MPNENAGTCPLTEGADHRKSAEIATANTQPDEGAYWVVQPTVAKQVLRHKQAFQAGAGAEFVKVDNPEHTSVFFLDGADHFNKRRKTQRFLSPQAVSKQHYKVMEDVSRQLLQEFQQSGRARLEDISFSLAIEVVGEILGLTNSNQAARARRIQRVLSASIAKSKGGVSGFILTLKRAIFTYWFFLMDVKPAMRERKRSPKEDALSFYVEEGYSDKAIIIECLTYGTAGMLTTREFIVMAAWYMFEDGDLRARFLEADVQGQLAILMEILRLEPVAAMIHRRVNEEISLPDGEVLPEGQLYGIDIRKSNVDEEMVGECPFSVDPDRAKRMKDIGRFLSFGDGPHSCPGWQVALHETRIFLQQLFRVTGIQLERAPDIGWNEQVKGYELRNAYISCVLEDASG